MWLYICIYIYVCVCVCVCVCVRVCMYVCIYIYLFIYKLTTNLLAFDYYKLFVHFKFTFKMTTYSYALTYTVAG